MSRVYRATLKCSYSDGTLIEPSVHYQTDVPLAGGEPDHQDVVDGIYDLLGTAFLNTLPVSVTFDDLVAAEQTIAPDIGVVGTHHVGAVGTGQGSGQLVPRALVPLFSLHTDVHSRSARGHFFGCSPGGTAPLESGLWASSGVQPYLDAFAALLDNSFDLGTAQITHVNPVVYSRKRHQQGASPYTFRVTSAVAKTRPTWLRSRLTTP